MSHLLEPVAPLLHSISSVYYDLSHGLSSHHTTMTLALVMLQSYMLGLQAKVHLGCYAVRVLSAPHLYEGCLDLSLISLHATVSPHARQN